jgi:hypothetical protein
LVLFEGVVDMKKEEGELKEREYISSYINLTVYKVTNFCFLKKVF